ncbi:MAG: hypothetical protein Q9165_008024 [Trypethelium subeluteriae]
MKILTLLSTLLTTLPLLATPFKSGNCDTSCPTNGTLPSSALSPSLIIPISARQPTRAFSPTTLAKVTPSDFCTIFNLEIPPSAINKTCTLEFLFPTHEQTTAFYSFDGPGEFVFNGYAYGAGANSGTTYETQPASGPGPPAAKLVPGKAYVLNEGSCGVQPGQMEAVTVSGALCSNDTYFEFEQTREKGCAIGFYVVIS